MFFFEYLFWAFFFCLFGLIGIFFETRSIVYLLCFIEILYLGINMLLLLYITLWQDTIGILFSLLILALTAIETSIGLTLIFVLAKQKYTTHMSYLKFFKTL